MIINSTTVLATFGVSGLIQPSRLNQLALALVYCSPVLFPINKGPGLPQNEKGGRTLNTIKKHISILDQLFCITGPTKSVTLTIWCSLGAKMPSKMHPPIDQIPSLAKMCFFHPLSCDSFIFLVPDRPESEQKSSKALPQTMPSIK